MKSSVGRRTPQQEDYMIRHQECRVCHNPSEHAHHINRNRKDDSDEELEALCMNHHTGNNGVHIIGVIKFCERYHLTRDGKWMKVYGNAKSKAEYKEEVGKLSGAN